MLVNAVGVGYENSYRSAVHEKVGLYVVFISLTRVVGQLFPVVNVALFPVR